MVPAEVTVKDLDASATSLLALLQSLATTLHPSNNNAAPPTVPAQTSSPESLALLNTASTLLKAQTTKLSLLLINDPFTPSAVKTMLSEIAAQSTPALAAAAQLCNPESYGKTMRDEARARTRRVLVELGHLVKEVQTRAAQRATSTSSSRDALASTGVVWAACDALANLQSLAIAGLYAQRTRDARATLDDAAAELREWRDDADDEGFESDEASDVAGADDAFDSAVFAAAAEDGGASLDRMLSAAHRLPSGRADLRALLDEALRRMRLVGTLYAAVAKRRFNVLKGESVTSENLSRADKAMAALARVPHVADEMAGRFYELDADGARDALGAMRARGETVCEVLRTNWAGSEDEFTAWCSKWREAMDAAPAAPSAGEAGS